MATARRAPPTSELTLPGNAQPFYGTALYARTNGYLKRWLVDIGARVKKGELLAALSGGRVTQVRCYGAGGEGDGTIVAATDGVSHASTPG